MSESGNWENAAAISFAFYQLADPYQRHRYENAPDIGATLAYKLLMYGDLFLRLERGELVAWGFQIAPAPSGDPVLIPRHCFVQRPTLDECEGDIITASGVRYERVRVAVAKADAVDQPRVLTRPKRKSSGRPSTYQAARDVLRELQNANPAHQLPPAARLLETFNAVYPKHAGSLGLMPIPLSERALRDHLKRFRQELAEIGNNDTAS